MKVCLGIQDRIAGEVKTVILSLSKDLRRK